MDVWFTLMYGMCSDVQCFLNIDSCCINVVCFVVFAGPPRLSFCVPKTARDVSRLIHLNQQYSHSLSSHYSILFPSAPRDAKGVQKNSQFRAEDALHGAAAAQLRPDELRAAQQRLEQLKRRAAGGLEARSDGNWEHVGNWN